MEDNLDKTVEETSVDVETFEKPQVMETQSRRSKKKLNRHYKNIALAFQKNDRIMAKKSVVKFSDGKRIPSWGVNYRWYVANCRTYFVEVAATPNGKPCGEFKISDVIKV